MRDLADGAFVQTAHFVPCMLDVHLWASSETSRLGVMADVNYFVLCSRKVFFDRGSKWSA